MLRIAIAIPTYNEAKNVGDLLTRIHEVCSPEADVDVTAVVLDDSSPDGTAQIVEALADSLATDNFRVRVILVAENFDYVLQMDADLSHDPIYISEFLAEARRGTDLVVGSRYIHGGGTPDWTWNRKFLSRGGNIYARLVLSRKISDYTGGFNMYSAKLLQKIHPEEITANGYGFIIEVKYRALRASQSLSEIPIVFLDRTHGVSKMPSGTLLRNFALVLRIKSAAARGAKR